MNKKALLNRLTRNGSEQEISDFLDSLDIDDIVDLNIELLGDF